MSGATAILVTVISWILVALIYWVSRGFGVDTGLSLLQVVGIWAIVLMLYRQQR